MGWVKEKTRRIRVKASFHLRSYFVRREHRSSDVLGLHGQPTSLSTAMISRLPSHTLTSEKPPLSALSLRALEVPQRYSQKINRTVHRAYPI